MENITVRGARTHNLKNIDLILPRDKLIVITGPSGSGKSSLAFDTLYAEGQRRYVESLSAYARQFLSIMEKPDVDHIEGLSPAISIEQKSTSHNPRSTVGTITEIYDYLRLLFARAGIPYCPDHHIPLTAQTISQMVDQLLALPLNTKIMIMAPVVHERKGEHVDLLKDLERQGFIRARIDGEVAELATPPTLDLRRKHTIEVIVDRIKINPEQRLRLTESLETATKLAEGIVNIGYIDHPNQPDLVFSSKFACPHCGYSIAELEPRLFSFNSPVGACPSCDGLGVKTLFNPTVMVKNTTQYANTQPCPECHGTRLKMEARNVFVAEKNLPDITTLPVGQAQQFFSQLTLQGQRAEIAGKITKEINERLNFLVNVGLDYLTLNRNADSLSGGEAQRIRLASQIGAGLVGVLYILDEPTIGLHQRDNARLLSALVHLRDLGNTVIVVEHDEDTIRLADHIVDIGPGAGIHGGQVSAQGTLKHIMQNQGSLTGAYLTGKYNISVPEKRIAYDPKRLLELQGACGNNLHKINVKFPIGLLTCITGVSGSGKSTLINDTLYPLVATQLGQIDSATVAPYQDIKGLAHIDKVIAIDQNPIGRTPRSNPATYTGIFTPVRELFAGTQEARSRGYQIGRFSFNVSGGRCEACQGDGVTKVEMHFLPDVYVACDVCKGQRYNRETLEIRFKGKSILDVLNMTVEDALPFFSAIPVVAKKLQTLMDVGLGYITLGQNATTLSGGEAQRVKLSKELSKRDTGNTLYILDEPTTGLHFHDIQQLLNVLHQLRNHGNTIIVIEHNLDVIKTADWIIDLGPEGGNGGGHIVAQGTPEQIAAHTTSYTGQFLRHLLK